MSQVHCAIKALIKKEDKFLIVNINVQGEEFWDLPGGKVDFGESPYETLHREIKEEIDLKAKIIKPLGMWWFFRKVDGDQVVCNTFLCEPEGYDVDISKNPDTEKITKFKWITKEEFLSDECKVAHKSFKEFISKVI